MPSLRPLNEILPPQQPAQPQYQPQPQQPAQPQYQPQPQYQQPAPQTNSSTSLLQNTSQLDQMRNNGRVELVVQDAQQGYVVISTDQLNISAIEMQNPSLGQELRLFDTNNDGWIVEQELKAAAVGQTPVAAGGEKTSTFEHVASSTLGGGLFGGAVGGLANKFGLNIGAKFGVKGWVAGMAAGAAIGLVGGFMTKPKKDDPAQNYTNSYGYRNETQWNNTRLIKTIL
ncbi:MAG: hypothetical protein ACAI44_02220 [Candidatus Sericytochromatia bacterium]